MEDASGWTEGTPVPIERRGAPRINLPPTEVDKSWAVVRDISETGISLLVEKPLIRGYQCDLMLTDSFFHTTEELRAEVVWCCDNCVGLRWVELSPKQAQWLHNGFKRWRMKTLPARLLLSVPA